MKRDYNATIYWKVTEEHPDRKYVIDINEELSFSDTYMIDEERFMYDREAIIEFIKYDMSIVAGGGYDNKHIYDVRYEINGKAY